MAAASVTGVGDLERFRAVVDRPDAELPLDEAAMVLASFADPAVDVDRELGRLDALAERCSATTLAELAAHLFQELGFRGNHRDYHDPRNSYLPSVLDRRVGIPVSLSVLTMTVGSRVGLGVVGIGMPGHFLLRAADDRGLFVDPFGGGALLDERACEARFVAVHGDGARFDPAYLAPIGHRAIVARMLANLGNTFEQRGDGANLTWVLRLRCVLPGASPDDRARLASVLAATGRFDEAASTLDALALAVGGELGRHYEGSADRIRARLN
jgi:regulator of sirC expression with transglutaminase-like and TPR domain